MEYPDIAYPEVVSYTENEDGTVMLIINAVYPNRNMSKEFSHTTIIRPLSEERFQYVSNEYLAAFQSTDRGRRTEFAERGNVSSGAVDGTFRYLSNAIEQKELELPLIEK